MKLDEGLKLRLQFLCRVVKKEANYLQETDARLFAEPLNVNDLQRIAEDALLAERLDAFVSRLAACKTHWQTSFYRRCLMQLLRREVPQPKI